jgi:MFS family permease
MFVLAYAVLTTYQVYYLLDKIGSAEADVPRQIFLGTLVQSVVVVAASLIGGKLSDRTGRRKLFVLTAAVVYGLGMFALAIASDFNGFLVGMAIGGRPRWRPWPHPPSWASAPTASSPSAPGRQPP